MLHKSIETETYFFQFPIRSTAVEFSTDQYSFSYLSSANKTADGDPFKGDGPKARLPTEGDFFKRK